ncbi:hypothetical protein [Streptomyces aureus]|uniref:hypothetical protein n=1 Tax=Streptomyces aureus TaxID=193461 RepID=UPI0036BDF311
MSQVARLLARAPMPMTRTDILAALPSAVQTPHRRQMDELGRLLHCFPAFHEAEIDRWQIGRTNVQVTAPPWLQQRLKRCKRPCPAVPLFGG